MDLIKIGKFIADCRKMKKLTQEQLAEKLYITDRAVSKWERGLSLPDADKMIDLCNILDISVNELLIGEKINMKDYEKKNEELLIEMAKQEEIRNKKSLFNMYLFEGTIVLFYFSLILVASYSFEEGPVLGAIILISTLILVVVSFFGIRMEVDAGYYECKNCHNKFVPKYLTALIAPHLNTTRYLKCPECGKRSWSKKVMTK